LNLDYGSAKKVTNTALPVYLESEVVGDRNAAVLVDSILVCFLVIV